MDIAAYAIGDSPTCMPLCVYCFSCQISLGSYHLPAIRYPARLPLRTITLTVDRSCSSIRAGSPNPSTFVMIPMVLPTPSRSHWLENIHSRMLHRSPPGRDSAGGVVVETSSLLTRRNTSMGIV